LQPRREHFSSIVIGVIASLIASFLFTIFSNPVLWFLNYIITSLITPFYKEFVDSQYAQAALGSTDPMLFGLKSLIQALFIGIALTMVMTTLVIHKFSGSPEDDNSRITNIVTSNKGKHILRYSVIIWACIFVPSLIITIAKDYVAVQARATLDVRLRALAPYLSEADSKTLTREWAMMRSRASYDQINLRLDEISNKYHVPIPIPLI